MNKSGVAILFFHFISIVALANQADSLFQQANEAFIDKDFATAIRLYEEVGSMGFQSTELEYNLGNAHFRNGSRGKAVLHYERALLLDPSHEDTRHNLAVATAQLDGREQLPEFFLTKWWRSWRMALPSGAWGGIALALWWIGLGGLGLWQLGKTRELRKTGFVVGVVALLLCLLPFSLAWSRVAFEKNTGQAIVLTERPPLKSAPDKAGSEILKLQEGEKLELLDHLSGYWQVRLPNGEKGWVAENDLEEI